MFWFLYLHCGEWFLKRKVLQRKVFQEKLSRKKSNQKKRNRKKSSRKKPYQRTRQLRRCGQRVPPAEEFRKKEKSFVRAADQNCNKRSRKWKRKSNVPGADAGFRKKMPIASTVAAMWRKKKRRREKRKFEDFWYLSLWLCCWHEPKKENRKSSMSLKKSIKKISVVALLALTLYIMESNKRFYCLVNGR